MDSRERPPVGPADARDAALRRASTLTKWAGVAAVALTGAVAGFVAQAKPGHSTTSGQAKTGGSSGRSQPASSSSTQPSSSSNASARGEPTLSPPSTPPAPAPSAPVVSSGGS